MDRGGSLIVGDTEYRGERVYGVESNMLLSRGSTSFEECISRVYFDTRFYSYHNVFIRSKKSIFKL